MKKEKEPKPKKPKKEKRPKKDAKPAEQQENGEGKAKKKPPIFLLLIPVVLIAAAVLVIFVIKPFGGEDDPGDDPGTVVEPDPEPPKPILPKEYVMNGVSISALTTDDLSAKAWVAKTVTYTYTGLSNPGETVSGYVKQLTASGYSVVDEDFVRTESRPDFSAPEGSVLMARNKPAVAAAEEPEEDAENKKDGEDGEEEEPVWQEEVTDTPKVVTVRVTWTEGSCVVTADEAEGTVTSPPGSAGAGPMISMDEVLEIMKSLSPSDLRLDGESMEGYRIYVRDGSVLVGGRPCMYVSVYDANNPQQTNQVVGTFLMTTDGTILYRLNPDTNRAERVDVDLTHSAGAGGAP